MLATSLHRRFGGWGGRRHAPEELATRARRPTESGRPPTPAMRGLWPDMVPRDRPPANGRPRQLLKRPHVWRGRSVCARETVRAACMRTRLAKRLTAASCAPHSCTPARPRASDRRALESWRPLTSQWPLALMRCHKWRCDALAGDFGLPSPLPVPAITAFLQRIQGAASPLSNQKR